MIPLQAAMDAKAAQYQTGASNLAAALALAVAGPESGYNPNAIGDSGSSFGYTQLHTNALGDGGGLGNGHAERDLLDGVYNFSVAMGYLQGRLNGGASPWEALSPWSARPAGYANLNEALAALGATPMSGVAAAGSAGAGVLVLAGLLVWLLSEVL